MEDKKNYTKQEVEEMLLSLDLYKTKYTNRILFGYADSKEEKSKAIKEVNKIVEKCEQRIPKSLIDKLKIKKIE